MDLILYSMAAIAGILGLYFVVPYCVRKLLKRKFLAIVKKNGHICLTFDDGPGPESTPVLLDLLDELEIKATFFLIGQNVEKYPELCQKIIQRGHEVGDHGHRHIHPWTCFPCCAAIDLFRGSLVLKKHADSARTFWLRPPYGKLNLMVLFYVLWNGRKLAFWDVDSRDYHAQPPEQLSSLVLQNCERGSVILMHERPFDTNHAFHGNLTAIKTIVQEMQRRGCTFATVSEAVEGTIDPVSREKDPIDQGPQESPKSEPEEVLSHV